MDPRFLVTDTIKGAYTKIIAIKNIPKHIAVVT